MKNTQFIVNYYHDDSCDMTKIDLIINNKIKNIFEGNDWDLDGYDLIVELTKKLGGKIKNLNYKYEEDKEA